MIDYAIPRASASLVDGRGAPTPEWYNFFRTLLGQESGEGLTAELQALAARVSTLEADESASLSIQGVGSVTVYGTPQSGVVQITLQGDMPDPGPTYYYGTGPDGIQGWHPVADTVEAEAGELTKSVDASGVSTFGLADLTPTPGGTLKRLSHDTKGRRSEEADATTSHLPEGSNLYYTDTRADARIAVAKADPDGIASLVSGKLDPGQLPALAITETFVVNTQAAMLSLVAQPGDVAVRSDEQKSYILTAEPASTLANWQELLVPTGVGVSSFNGRTGSVVPATGDYTPAQVGAEPAFAAGTAAQYRRGDKTWRDFATDVRGAVLTGLSTASNAVVTAADTVLQALGKLQAQMNLRAESSHGTYTPTLTNVTNISSSTASLCQWLRVGNVVTVSGRLDCVPASAAAAQIDISLPVPSNLSGVGSLGGSLGLFSSLGITPAVFFPETTNDRARCLFTAGSTLSHAGGFSFTYVVS